MEWRETSKTPKNMKIAFGRKILGNCDKKVLNPSIGVHKVANLWRGVFWCCNHPRNALICLSKLVERRKIHVIRIRKKIKAHSGDVEEALGYFRLIMQSTSMAQVLHGATNDGT